MISVICTNGHLAYAKDDMVGQTLPCPICGEGVDVPEPYQPKIRVVCSNGHELTAPTNLAGETSSCPACGVVVKVPELERKAIRVSCSNGHVLNARPESAGKESFCPACGVSVQIPNAADDSFSDDEILGLFDSPNPSRQIRRILEPGAGSSIIKRRCPRCSRTVPEASRVCPQCRLFVGEPHDMVKSS